MTEQSPAEAIFFAALEKGTPEERAAYLDAACGADSNLRQRVERLLAAHPQVGSFLEPPPAGAEAETVPPSSVQAGAVIDGRYKLLQPIGEGGMGSVWMAQQTNPVTRLVAVKLIKTGMDSGAVLARFEAERQALAVMDHPNIAKVLDAGGTETGRPYFVMELVKGTPITKYCDGQRLPLRQRLELFIPVCQALQHAHQKGIIHRDIKPSNVLIAPYDGKPVVKVIDFGVAKATGQRLTEKTLFTEFGAVIGTLEYMSPEQAELNNQDIDTRSDIYSLGVLLYELLTGTTPLDMHRLRGAAFAAILMQIQEQEAPRPSVRLTDSKESLPSISAQRQTEPARLARLVRGELDWIVMKSLEKDRNRRYETANGLARDIERYLHEEPVEACPPSAAYRLRKLARKHRGLLSAAATIALLLLISAGVSSWLAVQATRAKQEADGLRIEAETSEQKALHNLGLFEGAKAAAEARAEAAKASAAEARQALNRFTAAKGIQVAEEGDPFTALQWFVKPLARGELPPTEEQIHRARLACYLRHTSGRPILRHILFPDGPVSHAAFSPDAKQLLTLGQRGIQVWDVNRGSLVTNIAVGVHDFTFGTRVSTSAQFSPDGKRILAIFGASLVAPGIGVLGSPGPAAVWTFDARSGRPVEPPYLDWGTLLHHPEFLLPQTPLQWLANLGAVEMAGPGGGRETGELSRDGRRVLFGYGPFLRLMDLSTRKPIGLWLRDASWRDDPDYALSPDGQSLLLMRNGQVRAYGMGADWGQGRPLHPGSSPVKSVAFSPDGLRALSYSEDGTAQVWDTKTWLPLTRMRDPDSKARTYGEFSPDGRLVASWGSDGFSGIRDLAWWEVQSGRLVRALADREHDLQGSNWRPPGQQLLRVSKRGEVTLWNVAAPDRPGLVLPHGSRVNLALYGPDGRTLATVTEDGQIRIWELGAESKRFALTPPGDPAFSTSMQLSYRMPGGWHMSVFSLTGRIGQERVDRLLPAGTRHDGEALSLDESRVLTAVAEQGSAKSLQLWDAKTGRPLGKPLEGGSDAFTFAGFSPDSRLVVATQVDGTVQLLDARTGERLGNPLKHGALVSHAAFSPNGEVLVTCGEDHLARLWRTRTGEAVGEGLRHLDVVTLGTFSADGRLVATAASLDGIIHLWDERGTPRGTLQVRNGRAWGLLFHPNGMLLVYSSDHRMRLWDVATLQEVSPPMAARAVVMGISQFDATLGPAAKFESQVLINRAFEAPTDDRPVGDLVKLVEHYSGRRFDDQGATPLSRQEQQALWQELHAKYPEEFAVSREAQIDWRIEQLKAVGVDQPVALAFHRRWLAAELDESGWQPLARSNDTLEADNYRERLWALAQYSRHAEAAAGADVLAARSSKDAYTLYYCACVHALAAGATKADAELSRRYADRGLAVLRQAIAAGFQNLEHMRKDPDLDSLRGREEFQQLFKKLEEKTRQN